MKTDILKKALQSVLGSCRGQACRNMDNFLAHRPSSSLLTRKNVDLIVTRRLLSSSSSHLSGSSNLRLRPTPSSYKDNATPKRFILTSPVAQTEAEWIEITFVRGDGTRIPTKAKVGDNILDVVVNNSIDLDGFGACEGTLACSTCHVVFKNEDFEKITEKVTDEEMDMLDMAYGLTDTSRLGCQVCLKKDMDGLEIKVPAGVHDARS